MKSIAGLFLAAATLLAIAPDSSAAAWVSRGTYHNDSAAVAKCNEGIRNGWWDGCRYCLANPQTGTVELLTNR